jgi:xanthine dehydrogenase accessory factor
MGVWAQLLAAIDAQGAGALVTLCDVSGSSPREDGARMVLRPDGAFSGTIGGGALEWQAMAQAQRHLQDAGGNPLSRKVHALGPDLGQCCGGRVTVQIERFDKTRRGEVAQLAQAEARGSFATQGQLDGAGFVRRRIVSDGTGAPGWRRQADGTLLETFGVSGTGLLLCGAGHVARALVLALAPLPFAVTWIDPRADAFPERHPANVTARRPPDMVAEIAAAPSGTLVAVMTHSHALDLDLVRAALTRADLPYVGLIGSQTKRARFVSALHKSCVAQDALARLVCPIGDVGIRDKAPAIIAAAITVELLRLREALAKRDAGRVTLASEV